MIIILTWFDAQCKINTNNLIRNYEFVIVVFSRNLYFLFVYSILRTLTVIHNNHDLTIAGHPRYIKTYSSITQAYYRLNMSREIRKDIQKCRQRTKLSNHLSAKHLHPLLILGRF